MADEKKSTKIVVPKGMVFPEVSVDMGQGHIVMDEAVVSELLEFNGIKRVDVSGARLNTLIVTWYKEWINAGGIRRRTMDELLVNAGITPP